MTVFEGLSLRVSLQERALLESTELNSKYIILKSRTLKMKWIVSLSSKF